MQKLTPKQERMLAKANRRIGKLIRKHERLHKQEQAALRKFPKPTAITVLDN